MELREPESFCGTFLWNLGTFICGTWELVRVEPFIWNLGKPEPLCGTRELLRVEPVCGTLGNLHLYGNLVPGFGRLPQTTPKHPEALLEEPQAFQAVGE